MNAIERQEFRLEILKKLCGVLNSDLDKTLEQNGAIFKLFPNCSEEELLSNSSYLEEKGYITYKSIALHGITLPIMIKVTTRAIDLIEKIETKMSTADYEQDFSKTALNNFSNIINSQIIVSSPGASINISNNEEIELTKYLDDLMNLPALKGGVSCKRCPIDEVRSVRKLFNCGVYYHSLLALPNLTALKGGVLDPTANKKQSTK
jgi:hypothetical protein